MSTNQTLTVAATTREPGKSTSRGLRNNRTVPAVVYGPKTKPLTIAIPVNDAVKFSSRGFENRVITLESADSTINGLKVLRKSHDIHPVTRQPIHLDFFAPDMTQKVRVNVKIIIEGKAAGTAEGGLVTVVRRDVEIETLPLEIPESFTLDVSDLGLNESKHVSDIKFPAGVKVITSSDETIVTCAEVKEEALAAAVVDPAAAAAPGATPAAGAAAPGAAAAPAKK